MATGQLLHTLKGHSWSPWAAFSPDGTRLLSGSPGGPVAIKLWDAKTGQLVRNFGGQRSNSFVDAVFSPDGARIVSGGTSLKTWDATSGKLLSRAEAPGDRVYSRAFSRDGTRVLRGMPDTKTLQLWDGTTGRVLATLREKAEDVSRVAALSPDGSRAVSGGGWNEKTVKVWDAASGRLLRTLAHPNSSMR